ncbi:uncharacterized protein LOC129861926 isoform X2 [Salvelinus fontinalis]|nr:uncharacterized protein LOC129861926 isoform X2 [Salvelinus fontinalis]XP_055789101.1 uncharacterized protein LOC129861926 isoform X2 [Salvelinus fontinalis]
MAERLAEELNREKDPQAQLDEAINEEKRLAEELNPEKDPQAQLEEAIKEAKRLAEELNPEKDPQAQLDEAIKEAKRLTEELNREKDPQAQLDEAINEEKRLAEELNPEKDPQAQLEEAIKEAKRLAEELNPEKDPQAQLDEAIKEAKRLTEELNREKDPQAQLDEAIKEAKRLAEKLNREKDPQAQLDEAKRLAEELNPERENKKKKTNKPPGIRFRWIQRDVRGQIVPQTRKATTSTSFAPRASTSRARLVQHLGPVTEEESETSTSGLESTPVLNIDEEIYCFLPLDVPEVICGCLTSTIHVGPGKHIILVGINGCYNVTVPVLTCTTCLSTWTANLADLIKNGYWPATVNCDTIYQVDLFSSFEELKVSAPGMSRLAFMRILEQRTDYFGRNGMICGDTFQKSFFEWTYCRSEIDQVCDIQYFDCPACSPSMLAVSVDGNKKLYRFKKGTDDKGFFDGLFICKDEDVSDFVNYVHTKTKHGYGKGVCGASQWTAAKESSRKTNNKLDEEGLEVAVCRHGILLRSLNMMRGEIFAYPLFLQKELSGSRNIQFMCTDVICKFWPYLTKVALHCPELATLLDMKPHGATLEKTLEKTLSLKLWSLDLGMTRWPTVVEGREHEG